MAQRTPNHRPHSERRLPWPAIIAVGIAAVLSGVLLAAIVGTRSPAIGEASGSPSASASQTDAEASASEAASPTPTVEPTPVAAEVIPNRAIVEVAADGLALRTAGNDAADVVTTLPAGRRLFIIGDPAEPDGTRWYRVAQLVTDGCGETCDAIGYVGTPARADENPTITEAAVTCPASPMTEQELGKLDRLEALHCYGRSEIVVTGTIDTPCCSVVGPIVITPEWLGRAGPVYLPAASLVDFRVAPDSSLQPPERGDVVRITGHLEDAAAVSCRAGVDQTAVTEGTEVNLPGPARVVLDCRSTFVWTDYTVTDHVDLGPKE